MFASWFCGCVAGLELFVSVALSAEHLLYSPGQERDDNAFLGYGM